MLTMNPEGPRWRNEAIEVRWSGGSDGSAVSGMQKVDKSGARLAQDFP